MIPLQKLAGIKEGDSPDNFVVTLHFVLCPELPGLALHKATVGASNRDSRYGRFMADPLTEADLVRYGLRLPTVLPPLQADGGRTTDPGDSGDVEKQDKTKAEGDQK